LWLDLNYIWLAGLPFEYSFLILLLRLCLRSPPGLRRIGRLLYLVLLVIIKL
jgi:hypothetical protein